MDDDRERGERIADLFAWAVAVFLASWLAWWVMTV